MKLAKFKAPNTFLIIFSLIVLAAILTWVIPGGSYDKEIVDGKERLKEGSFEYVESNPQGPGDILMAPIEGFVDAALIIGFVFLVGGAFGVLQRTRAVDSAIKAIAKAHNRSSAVRIFLIPILMTIFSLMGAIFGFSEEVIPFVLIFIPLALVIGYDSITGVAIPFIGAGDCGIAAVFRTPVSDYYLDNHHRHRHYLCNFLCQQD